jgi:REP element-mobilizing transposase RayT
MRSEPLAYLLTWTCYGARLHGDAGGSVERPAAARGLPVLAPDPERVRAMRERMRCEPVVLDEHARRIVDETINDHCGRREWWLGAHSVRSNHVHCVVAAPGVRPERVMHQLKSWCSRRLREQAGFDGAARIWTRHGSTRYLWDQRSVDHAVFYVRDGQDLGSRFAPPA